MSFEVEYDANGKVISKNPYIESTEPEEPQDFVEELPEEAHAAAPEEIAPVAKKTSEQSWAELRRKAEQAERERDEYRRQLDEQKRAAAYTSPAPEEDLSINVNDDELVEGRTISKVNKKMAKLEQKLAQYEQMNSAMLIENKLKAQYPDFDQVVSVKNVQILEEQYPEIVYTLRSSNDMYNQGVSAYTMIKKLGIVPDDDSSSALKRIQSNSTKPRSAAGIQSQRGDSPLTKANPFAEGLTDELKAQLWRDMNSAIRNK